MEKAVNLLANIEKYDSESVTEFFGCISDLIDHPEVQKLSDNSQHLNTSRLDHSLNVSFYSFMLAKVLKCDYRSAARGGLLHDLFYYDFKSTTFSCMHHAFWHPHFALENAKKMCELNKIEEDIIIKHMWPMTLSLPKYKESYIVCMADKYCAAFEVTNSLLRKFYKSQHSNQTI